VSGSKPQAHIDDMQIAWGLGWGLETKSGTFFQWGDDDQGRFKAFVMGSMQQRCATVVLTNGFHGMAIMPELIGKSLSGPILRLLGWVIRCFATVSSGVLYQVGFEALDRFRLAMPSSAATKGNAACRPPSRKRDRMSATTSASVKVFGCRPMMTAPRTPGPAYANLQWRKPRRCGEVARQTLWGFGGCRA